jgi:hypothetical protein
MSSPDNSCNDGDEVGPVVGVEPTIDFSCRTAEAQPSLARATDDRTIECNRSVS